MNDIDLIQQKLKAAQETRGLLAKIAREASVSERTIYNLLHSPGKPNPATVSKLLKYFKRELKKEAKK